MKFLMAPLTLVLLAAPTWAADKRVDEAVARAQSHFDKGKPDEALKVAQKMASQVNTAEAHAAYARIQIKAGQVEEAAATLAKALELGASGPPEGRAEALAALSALDLIRGSGKDALAHAQEAEKLQSNATTLAALARAQARADDPAAALQTADRAVQAAATSAAAHEARGLALLAQAKGAEADAAFRKALELDPKWTAARVGLARALLLQNKAAEAEAEARKASEADARAGEAFAVLGKAILAVDPKKWGDAIAQAQQGAFVTPRHAAVQTEVGALFEANGNLDQAAAAYRKALESDPSYGPARVALVAIQVRRGQNDEALKELDKLAAEMPNNADVQLQRGRILLRKADYTGAAEALEKAVTLVPGNAEAQAMYGTALQYTGRRPDALSAYTKAVQLDAKNVQYKVTYGLLLGLANREAEGIKILQEVVATPGYKDSAGYVNLGWLYRNIEPPRSEESVTAYRKALELNPKEAQAALGMGWAYSYLKRYDESIASFNKAIELEPKTAAEANNGIAWGHFFKKDMAKAKEFGEKAKAAGRDVSSLTEQITRVERGEQAEEAAAQRALQQAARAPTEDACTTLLSGGSAGARRGAAAGCARAGAGGLNALIRAATTDKDMGVRTAAVQALCTLGPAGKPAVPHLNAMNQPLEVPPASASKEELEAAARWEDFRRVVRDCLLKLR
jgi:tetratricopeptide (TPR) repeat protein